MTIDGALSSSLAMLVAAMAPARDRWWIIGSAAVRLHGVATTVADVDVLVSVRDADDLDTRLRVGLRPGVGNALFRSSRYGQWCEPPLPIEFMADLTVRGVPLAEPTSRVPMCVGDATVYVPDVAEMVTILDLFGRAKDRARAASLRARPS